MATLREHLKKFHTHASSHHDGLAEVYSKLAGLSKSTKSEMKPEEQEGLYECLGKIAEHHEAAAEFHRGMMEECSKVTGDELGKSSSDLIKRLEVLENSVVPTRVSAVVPTETGVRAVPRAGQRAFAEKPVVATQFSKLVEIEE